MPRYQMIELPGGCRCSKLSVSPKNYRQASTQKDWFISYRFYDPRYPKPKQVQVRGMNEFKDRKDRIEATETLMEIEMVKLTERGFNPFTGDFTPVSDIDPLTPLPQALEKALSRLKLDQYTVKTIKYMVKALKAPDIPVSQVKRKHIRAILEKLHLSPVSYNHYRAYLMMLFKELVEMEAVETNPVREISTRQVTKKIRQTLTDEEREKVSKHLQKHYPGFYRYLQIFFHSGCRTTELFALKRSDVDLTKQEFTITVKKGRQHKEVVKVIKDIALPYWEELLSFPGDYLFCKGFLPGTRPLLKERPSKLWNKAVKKKLGITADFYSLKHLHTTQVVELVDNTEAAKHNSHTTTTMVDSIYDVNKAVRDRDKVKKLTNKF